MGCSRDTCRCPNRPRPPNRRGDAASASSVSPDTLRNERRLCLPFRSHCDERLRIPDRMRGTRSGASPSASLGMRGEKGTRFCRGVSEAWGEPSDERMRWTDRFLLRGGAPVTGSGAGSGTDTCSDAGTTGDACALAAAALAWSPSGTDLRIGRGRALSFEDDTDQGSGVLGGIVRAGNTVACLGGAGRGPCAGTVYVCDGSLGLGTSGSAAGAAAFASGGKRYKTATIDSGA